MEYMQVKTPAIERWEKEVLTNGDGITFDQLLVGAPHHSGHHDLAKIQEEINRANGSGLPASFAGFAEPLPQHAETAKGATKKRKGRDDADKPAAKKANTKKTAAKDLSDEDEVAEGTENYEMSESIRKEMHNAVEKRRRDKINTTIMDLKNIVPNCHQFATNKASILHHTAEHIKTLSSKNQQLLDTNKKLTDENTQLLAELTDLYRMVWQPMGRPPFPGQQYTGPGAYQQVSLPYPSAGQSQYPSLATLQSQQGSSPASSQQSSQQQASQYQQASQQRESSQRESATQQSTQQSSQQPSQQPSQQSSQQGPSSSMISPHSASLLPNRVQTLAPSALQQQHYNSASY